MQASNRERAEAIQELRQAYKLRTLLELEGMAKSTYYYHAASLRKGDQDLSLRKKIFDTYHLHKGRYGYRRITLSLRQEGIVVNHKKVERIMQELGIKSTVRIVKYRSYKGTVGKVAPNVLNRNFIANKPLEKLTTDISQVKIGSDKCYISPVIDMFNGEVLACDISQRPDLKQIDRMLKALFKGRDLTGAIFHSDQGWQYQHSLFVNTLKNKGVTQSMSRKGNCYDNALMESFFGSMKSELLYLSSFKTIDEFEKELKKYITYYNRQRIKTRLKMSPVQFREQYQNKL
jgi:transposase InsO family protein